MASILGAVQKAGRLSGVTLLEQSPEAAVAGSVLARSDRRRVDVVLSGLVVLRSAQTAVLRVLLVVALAVDRSFC